MPDRVFLPVLLQRIDFPWQKWYPPILLFFLFFLTLQHQLSLITCLGIRLHRVWILWFPTNMIPIIFYLWATWVYCRCVLLVDSLLLPCDEGLGHISEKIPITKFPWYRLPRATFSCHSGQKCFSLETIIKEHTKSVEEFLKHFILG